MKNLTIQNIVRITGGTYFGEEKYLRKEVMGVALDSRKIEKDFLFLATKGECVDGHSFIQSVIEKGAAFVVCEEVQAEAYEPYVKVEDSFIALKQIATFYLEQLTCKVVGITGSVGKTSTKEIVASVLEQKYHVLKTEGNFNNEVGLPLTILRLREEHEIAVLEMGISDFGEMTRLAQIAKPDVAIITNIGQCHLENLGTRQGILQAKTEIIPYVKTGGVVCINGDDDMLASIEKLNNKSLISYGLADDNLFYASDLISDGIFGTNATFHHKDEVIDVKIPIPGMHMIYNGLAAMAIGEYFDLSLEQIKKGLNTASTIKGRSNLIHAPNYDIIDDCYNANPVSMKSAIDLLCLATTKKVAILGDMGELGVNELELHAGVGEYVNGKPIDMVICIGNLSKVMYSMVSTEMEKHYFLTKEEFLNEYPNLLQKGDTILIKASHFMNFDAIVTELEKK